MDTIRKIETQMVSFFEASVLIRHSTAVHEKAFTLGNTTGFQTIRYGKDALKFGELVRTLKKDLEENFPEDSRIQILSSLAKFDKKNIFEGV